MSNELTVHQVRDKAGRRRFLRLPYLLHADNPNWVAPLRRQQARLFAGRNAFFEHADMSLLLAERSGKTVGRIAAIHNHAHNAHYDDRVGFFGFFECAGVDREAAEALFAAAERWVGARGLDRLRGPVNPSMNAECGLLIHGFDRPPAVLMPYNPPSYQALLEGAGFSKCKDLLAYLVDIRKIGPGTPEYTRMEAIVERIRRRYPEVQLRRLDMSRYEEEVFRFMPVFDEARRGNWGHVPITETEMLERSRELKKVVDPEMALFAEVGGKPAGVCMGLPDINEALIGLNGRLFPFGFLRILHRRRRIQWTRVFGVAALNKYRHMGIGPLLIHKMAIQLAARGYKGGEASWVLEDNLRSQRTIVHGLSPVHTKTYRVYEKAVSPAHADSTSNKNIS